MQGKLLFSDGMNGNLPLSNALPQLIKFTFQCMTMRLTKTGEKFYVLFIERDKGLHHEIHINNTSDGT